MMKNVWREICYWSKGISVIFIVAILLQNFVAMPVTVEGSSMYPTLHHGDSVILWKFLYEPRPFDVVVFEYEPDVYHVKRLIGIPGQHIAYENDQLYVDGVPVYEYFLEDVRRAVAESHFSWNSGVFTQDFTLQDICSINGFECDVIPDGWFLVLGDPRPFTQDSRHIGLVREEQILGRASWVTWPLRHFGNIY